MLRTCFPFAALTLSTGCLLLVDEYANGSGGNGAGGGSGGTGGGIPCVPDVGPFGNEPKPRYEIAFGPTGAVAILGDVSFACTAVSGFGLAFYEPDPSSFDEAMPSECVSLPEPEDGTDFSVAQTEDHVAIVMTPAGEAPQLRVLAVLDLMADPVGVVELSSTTMGTTLAPSKVVATAEVFFVAGLITGAPTTSALPLTDATCDQGETEIPTEARTFVLRYEAGGTNCAMMTARGASKDTFGDLAINDAEVLVRTVLDNGDGRLLRLRQNFTVNALSRAEPGHMITNKETSQAFSGLTGYGNGGWATLKGTSAQLGTTSCCPLFMCCPMDCCDLGADEPFWNPVDETDPITHQLRGITTGPELALPPAYGFGQTSAGFPRVTGYGVNNQGVVWGNSADEWPQDRPGEVIGVQVGVDKLFFYVLGQTCDAGWRIERISIQE